MKASEIKQGGIYIAKVGPAVSSGVEIRLVSSTERRCTMLEKRQCWFLLESEPSLGNPDQFRVCLVTEDEPGYQATGHGEGVEAVEPWYWDRETCRVKNEQRGLSNEDVDKIVASSMFCHA